MFYRLFELFKFRIIRFIESNPELNLMIYNNIYLFKFLLPHEKDYYGMLKVCKNKKNYCILDIGANLGISSLGFRKLGFKNKIYAYEPNYFLYKSYLSKLKQKYKNFYPKNLALADKNETLIFYMPFYKSKCIHYFCTFDKKYLINSLKMTFPKIYKKIQIKKKTVKCSKYDDLKINCKPHFIKIDTEGYDGLILKGLKKTIRLYKPIILTEYNKEYFKDIIKILKNYKPHVYDIKNDRMLKLNSNILKTKVSRKKKKNFLSIRNIYFLPKDFI